MNNELKINVHRNNKHNQEEIVWRKLEDNEEKKELELNEHKFNRLSTYFANMKEIFILRVKTYYNVQNEIILKNDWDIIPSKKVFEEKDMESYLKIYFKDGDLYSDILNDENKALFRYRLIDTEAYAEFHKLIYNKKNLDENLILKYTYAIDPFDWDRIINLVYSSKEELIDDINTGRISANDIDETNLFLEANAIARSIANSMSLPENVRVKRKENVIFDLEQLGSYIGTDSNNNKVYYGKVLKNKRLDIILGIPDESKDELVDSFSKQYKSRIISVDWINERLKGFHNGYGGAAVHEESEIILEEYQYICRNRGDNIVLSIVGDSKEKVLKTIEIYNQNGYEEIYLHLNEIKADEEFDGLD